MTTQTETPPAAEAVAKPAEAKPEVKASEAPTAGARQSDKPAQKMAAVKTAKKPAAKSTAKRTKTRKAAKPRKVTVRKAAAKPATAKAAPKQEQVSKEMESVFENSLKQMQDIMSEFRGGFADLPLASEEFSEVAEATREATVNGMSEFNKELSTFTQSRMTECWETARHVLGAKSLPEALEVQNRYVQDAFKAYADEAQKLNAIATDVTQKAFAPMGNGFADTISKMFTNRAA